MSNGGPTYVPSKTRIMGDSGNVVQVNADGQIHTVMRAHVSTPNSSFSVLGIGEVFTGTLEDVLDHAVISIAVFSDVASAIDGLRIEFSVDGTNWDHQDVYTIPAATGKVFSFQPIAKYMRIVYTNGGIEQTVFRLQTILHKNYIKPSSHRIQDSIIGDDDAELSKAVLTGQDELGDYQNVRVTQDGNLAISDNSSGLSIVSGNVAGTSYIHKFGNAPDFDTVDGVVTLWDGADDSGLDAMDYTYSALADIDSLVSSDGGDTADIQVTGLDANYDEVVQIVTLTGQTRAVLGTALIRVFRKINVGASVLVGQTYCYVDSAITLGVPDDKTKVRAIIDNGNNQTLMAVYTIPRGKTGYMRDWFASVAGASKTSNYIIELRARPFGQVFQIKHRSSISDTGTSHIQHNYTEPKVFQEKTDIEMRVSATAVGATAASISGGFDIVLVDN